MRYLLILCFVLVGCQQPTPNVAPEFRESRREDTRRAAVSLAFYQPDSPHPNPPGPTPPGPQPGEKCALCNGTGRIKPDNRVEVECYDCGGDGILMPDDRDPTIRAARINMATALMQRLEIPKAEVEPQPVHQEPELQPIAAPVKPPSVDDIAAAVVQRLESKQASAPVEQPSKSKNQLLMTSNLDWLYDLSRAKEEARDTGKPALVLWTGTECAPCLIFERDVLENTSVKSALRRFVLVAVDFDTNEDLREQWKVAAMPTAIVVNSAWTEMHSIAPTLNAAQFMTSLTEALRRTLSTRAGVPSSSLSQSQQTERITYISEPTITYVQSSGSNGGYSQSYGSSGASYTPMSYSAYTPQYYSAPRYYTQPSYSSGWFGGYRSGGSVVCGPNGCFVQ